LIHDVGGKNRLNSYRDDSAVREKSVRVNHKLYYIRKKATASGGKGFYRLGLSVRTFGARVSA